MGSERRHGDIVATSQQTRFDTTELPEIDLEQVTISVHHKELLTDASLKLKAGTRYALVGRNGSGKSTLLEALADRLIPGIPSSLQITLVSQLLDDAEAVQDSRSVLEHVLAGHVTLQQALREEEILTRALSSSVPSELELLVNGILLGRARDELDTARRTASRRSGARGKEARAEEIKAEIKLTQAVERTSAGISNGNSATIANQLFGEVKLKLELLDAMHVESTALRILAGLGFTQSMIRSPYSDLSGGWRSRAALATGFLAPCDLLLLDEPSNFMDLRALLYLEKLLANPSDPDQTLILTSHDRTFLDNTTEETIHLRNGRLDYAAGSPSQVEAVEGETKLAKTKQQDALDKKRDHIEASINDGRKAANKTGDENRQRMIKSRQRKLDERWGAETSSKGGRFKLNRDRVGYHETRRGAIEIQGDEKEVRLRIEDPPDIRAIGSLVSLEGVQVGYNDKVVLDGVSMIVEPRGRLGLVGANGHGKTTLARLIFGELDPRSGSVTRHPNLRVGYFTQLAVEELSAAATSRTTAMEHLMSQRQTDSFEARSFLGRWGLTGRLASDTPIGMLSGGQKVRLVLALLFHRPPHLLILDEVTTHLDAYTIRALARALRDYAGAIILITHDRWFHKVLIEGAPMSTEAESAAEDNEEDRVPGTTFLVDRGRVRRLEKGMDGYERLVRARMKKAMA